LAVHPVVEVDEELCIGSGECVALAPKAFSLGASDLIVTVLGTAPHVDLDTLEDAAVSCPTGAIQIVRQESA